MSGKLCGVGIDLIEVERVAASLDRFGERFASRICGSAEMRQWLAGGNRAESLARRFAVKEACLKALGTGWAGGLNFSQVRLMESAEGGAAVRLHGAAADLPPGAGCYP